MPKKQLVRFASAGIPIQCKGSTLEAVKCSHDLGLSALEVEFVRGVKMRKETAEKVKAASKKYGVRISSHAPYWVNCCATDRVKQETTRRNLFQAGQATAWCGGAITVFHPGFYQGKSPEECQKLTIARLKEVHEKLKKEKLKVKLGAETVGKKSAYGSLDEVIALAKKLSFVEPVLDFAHLLARGDWPCKTEDDYRKLFSHVEKKLPGFGKNFHSHFSSIEYSAKGERNHLPVSANKPPYKPLMKMLAEHGYAGTIVCESPRLEYDALKMQEEYLKHR